ncbi:MAG: O-unit flippase-like protein [Paludibacter sp.]
MQIGKKDVIWNFVATTMRVASGLIVLPLVLHLLPSEEVGLWNIFLIIGSLAALLDFGFSNSFSRNITYIFSGVKELKITGYTVVAENDKSIDYGLLKSVISSMRRYYGILALVFLVLFFAVSPIYLTTVLGKYSGNKSEVWFAWFTYGVLVAYQLYTYYYSSLLIGRGLIKKNLQITIIGQASRIISSIIFLLLGFGLISLVIGQLVSDIVNRILCYIAFYDSEIKQRIKESVSIPVKEIMKIMTPNAVKIGITTIGMFLVNKLIVLIAPLFLSLSQIGSYGTTKQIIDLIVSFGALWFSTYYPKITHHRVNDNLFHLKRMYIKSRLILLGVFLLCGIGFIIAGPFLLNLIHSKTQLLPTLMIFALLIFAYLDSIQSISISLLLSGNEVPFMKSALLTGFMSISILFLLFYFTTIGIWGLILAPGISQLVYQDWKWPKLVKRNLRIKFNDYWIELIRLIESAINQIKSKI